MIHLRYKQPKTLATRFIQTAMAFLFVSSTSLAHLALDTDSRTVAALIPSYLVSWISLAAFGVLYASYPYFQDGLAPLLHYLLHAPGLALLCVGQALCALAGRPSPGLVTWMGSAMLALGMVLFSVNAIAVLRRQKNI